MAKSKDKGGEWRKIILSVAAVVAVIVIVAVVAGFSWKEKYDADYFVSDGAKLVMAMDDEIASFEEGEFEPAVTYVVYYYSGDKVNGMKVFFAYDDETEAKEANKNIKMDEKEWAVGRSLNGKYIVFEANEDQYEDLSVSLVKKMIESMREAGTLHE